MRKTTAFLTLLLAAMAMPSFAQRITATIRGTVTDSTGAVVPGVNVTVKNEGTGYTRSTASNSSGVYSFPELPLGTYTVEVALSGFKTSVVKGVALNVADDRAVNVRLETGTLTENVTVEVPAVAVKTIGGEVAGLVTGEQVRELPLNGRNFLQLTTLMPGVSQADDFNTKDRGLMSHISVSVSGSGPGGNMWTVDGANNNDVGSNGTILVFPSVDAIDQERAEGVKTPKMKFVSFLGLPRRRVLSTGLSAVAAQETTGPSAGGAPETNSPAPVVIATLAVAGQSP